MHDWIVGVQRAAHRAQPGVSVEELRRAENELGEQFPSDLADLYVAIGGGDLEGDVTLFKLSEPEHGVIEKTRKKMLGLPAAGLWRFGRKGDKRHLFAARASSLREHGETGLPTWCAELPSDAWLFGTWEEDQDGVRVYRNLEHMLSVLVPPTQTEEFGESTFVRALSAVEQALLSSVSDEQARSPEVEGAPLEATSKARAGKPARKAGTSRAPASRRDASKTSVPDREAIGTDHKPTRTQTMAAKAAKKTGTTGKGSSVDLEALIAAEERAAQLAEKALRKAEKALRKAEKAERKAAKKAEKTSVKGAEKVEPKGAKKAKRAEKKAETKGAKKAETKGAKKAEKAARKAEKKPSDKKPSVKGAKASDAKGAEKAAKKAGKKPSVKGAEKAGKKAAKKAEKKPSVKAAEASGAKGAKKAEKKPAVKGAKTAERPATKAPAKVAKAPKRTREQVEKKPTAKGTKAPTARSGTSAKKPVAKAAQVKRAPAKARATTPKPRA